MAIKEVKNETKYYIGDVGHGSSKKYDTPDEAIAGYIEDCKLQVLRGYEPFESAYMMKEEWIVMVDDESCFNQRTNRITRLEPFDYSSFKAMTQDQWKDFFKSKIPLMGGYDGFHASHVKEVIWKVEDLFKRGYLGDAHKKELIAYAKSMTDEIRDFIHGDMCYDGETVTVNIDGDIVTRIVREDRKQNDTYITYKGKRYYSGEFY